MKNIIFFPPGGPNNVFLFASKFPSNASYRFFVVVFPEKFTNAYTISSLVLYKKSFVTTDLPTPVSPVSNALKPLNTNTDRMYLYFIVSLVGTNISKNFLLASNSNVGT
jgi:hypothetical protein